MLGQGICIHISPCATDRVSTQNRKMLLFIVCEIFTAQTDLSDKANKRKFKIGLFVAFDNSHLILHTNTQKVVT